MLNSRLSVFFDRNPRHSKSTSNLSNEYSPPGQSAEKSQWQQAKRTLSRETLTVMHEYNFGKPLPPVPKRPTATSQRPSPQIRARTTPLMHPPDELLLKVIRRRSASARLEEMRIERDYQHKHDPELAISLAIASALPPVYLDATPAYWSPEETERLTLPTRRSGRIKEFQVEPYSDLQPQASTSKLKEDQFFVEDPLKAQIDETIAQYASFRLTEPTPRPSPQEPATMISPLNDIDHLYLERRRRRKRAQQQ